MQVLAELWGKYESDKLISKPPSVKQADAWTKYTLSLLKVMAREGVNFYREKKSTGKAAAADVGAAGAGAGGGASKESEMTERGKAFLEAGQRVLDEKNEVEKS